METKKTYAEKLLDPRWQRKRLEVLSRDNFTCQNCESTEYTLHVHHRVYQGSEPWEIDAKYLVTLCEYCHEDETLRKRDNEREFLNNFYKAGFLASDLSGLDYGFYHMTLQAKSEIITLAFGHALRDVDLQNYIIQAYHDWQKKLRGKPLDPEFLNEILNGK